ncbi:MAG TPA: ATP-binding protein [Kineosporiaceae bacterium]
MKQEDPAGPATADVGRRRGGALSGITGKIAAIVAGLLAVFVAAVGSLVYEVRSLGDLDPRILELNTGHYLQLRALVEFKEEQFELGQAINSGSNTQMRTQHEQAFRANADLVQKLLAQTVETLPPGVYRDETQRFQTEHTAVTAAYQRALDTFRAENGRDIPGIMLEVRDADNNDAAFVRFEDSSNTLDTEVQKIYSQHVNDVDNQVAVIIGIGAVLLVVLSVAAGYVIRRVVGPIRRLTTAAERISEHELPEAVAKIRNLKEGEEPPVLEPIAVDTRDETADLADAFHTLQKSALTLAAEQRQAELESAQMLVNLGRRNQNLLNRTLAYITELERTEQDPEILDRLFRLDHATTRIRRNAESMLVLAGAHQTRTWSVPAATVDVVRAALAEIEDYNRVDVYHVQDAAISGGAIADVVHLLAELLENATTFSPPSTKVTVVGQTVAEGYRIRVIDEGIGMTRSELDASNRTIQLAAEGRSATKLLGLYVVGRLAARRRIEVVLEASGGRGVTANVVLPRELLAEMPLPDDVPAVPETAAELVRAAEQTPQPARESYRQAGRTAGYEPARHSAPVHAARDVASGHERGTRREILIARDAVPSRDVVPPREVSARRELANQRERTTRPEAPRDANPSRGADGHGAPPREPGADGGAPSVVRRVPGAQLPDLGPQADDIPALATIDAGDVRGRLSSLQAGVRAGREAGPLPVEPVDEPAPVDERAPVDEPADVDEPAPVDERAPVDEPADVDELREAGIDGAEEVAAEKVSQRTGDAETAEAEVVDADPVEAVAVDTEAAEARGGHAADVDGPEEVAQIQAPADPSEVLEPRETAVAVRPVPTPDADARPDDGPGDGPDGSGKPGAVVEPDADEEVVAAPVVPVRVPGAQLPDLGLLDNDPDIYLAPPSIASRWALRSFQLDVDAARRLDLDSPDATEPARRMSRTPEES